MQALEVLLLGTIDHLHTVCDPTVFVELCRELWDRMGQVNKLIFYPTSSLLDSHINFIPIQLVSVGCPASAGR